MASHYLEHPPLTTRERKLLDAVKRLLKRHDAEDPGAAFAPDAGCIECTHGTVPNDRNTGLCPRHELAEIVAEAQQAVY